MRLCSLWVTSFVTWFLLISSAFCDLPADHPLRHIYPGLQVQAVKRSLSIKDGFVLGVSLDIDEPIAFGLGLRKKHDGKIPGEAAVEMIDEALNFRGDFEKFKSFGLSNMTLIIHAMNFGDPNVLAAIKRAHNAKIGTIHIFFHGPTAFFRKKGRGQFRDEIKVKDLSGTGQMASELESLGFSFNPKGDSNRAMFFTPAQHAPGPGRLMHEKRVLVLFKVPNESEESSKGFFERVTSMFSSSVGEVTDGWVEGEDFFIGTDGRRYAGVELLPTDNFTERRENERVLNVWLRHTMASLIEKSVHRSQAMARVFSETGNIKDLGTPQNLPEPLSIYTADGVFLQLMFTDGASKSNRAPNHRITDFWDYAVDHPEQIKIKTVYLDHYNITFDEGVRSLHKVLKAFPEAKLIGNTDAQFVNPAQALGATLVGVASLGDEGAIPGLSSEVMGSRVDMRVLRRSPVSAGSKSTRIGKVLDHLKLTVTEFESGGGSYVKIEVGTMNFSDQTSNAEYQLSIVAPRDHELSQFFISVIENSRISRDLKDFFVDLESDVVVSVIVDLLGIEREIIEKNDIDSLMNNLRANAFDPLIRGLRDLYSKAERENKLRQDTILDDRGLETKDKVARVDQAELNHRIEILEIYFNWLREIRGDLPRQYFWNSRPAVAELGHLATFVHMVESQRGLERKSRRKKSDELTDGEESDVMAYDPKKAIELMLLSLRDLPPSIEDIRDFRSKYPEFMPGASDWDFAMALSTDEAYKEEVAAHLANRRLRLIEELFKLVEPKLQSAATIAEQGGLLGLLSSLFRKTPDRTKRPTRAKKCSDVVKKKRTAAQ